MERLSRILDRASAALSRFAERLLILLGVAMSAVVILQVFFRFVVYVPFPWSEELARYLMIWMGLVGSFVALRRGRHIGVNSLVECLPPPLRRLTSIGLHLALIAFLALIAREGLNLALFNAAQKSPAMMIPMFYPYLAIPVGAALMIVELLAGLLRVFSPAAPRPGEGEAA
ncbi:MAG: TRAP transporter small permease [Desulfobacterales bacterium]